MANKQPWELYPHIWKNETAFFTYLRGHLRLLWSRYPAKNDWKESQMVKPPKGYTGRAKSLGKCYYCNEMFAKSHLEVDHVQQAGTCNSWETAQIFLYKLLDCNDNWVLACKPCHKIKSYAERHDMAFDEAMLEKQIIEFCKKPKQKVLDFLAEHQYTGISVSSAAKRRKLVELIFKEQRHVKAIHS